MESNINDIVERDWREEELNTIDHAIEETNVQVDDFFERCAKCTIYLLLIVLVIATGAAYWKCRTLHLNEQERILKACPSGTALRIIDDVNKDLSVAFSNRVSDFVFAK